MPNAEHRSAPSPRDGRRVAIAVGAVVATVVLGLLVTAVISGRRRLLIASRASLGNYAGVVTEQFANGFEALLRQSWAPILPPPGLADPAVGTDPIPLQDLVGMVRRLRDDPCRCYLESGPAALFRIERDPRVVAVVDSAGAPRPALEPALVDAALRLADTVAGVGWRFGYSTVETGGGPAFVFVSQRLGPDGRRFVYGLVVPGAHLSEEVFARAFRNVRLVPRSLLASVPNNRDYAAVDVMTASGVRLYSSEQRYDDGPGDHLQLPAGRGSLVVVAHINPSLKAALLPGGLPPAIPWRDLGMLALALLLVVGIATMGLRAVELARLRSDFASSVTHELRTPLTQIRLAAETALLGRGSVQRSLRGIVDESARLQQLIDNVLHFSRAERRMVRVSPGVVVMAPLITEIVTDFQPRVADRGIEWVTHVAADLVALADSGAVWQVLRNLFDNAARYGPPGGRVVVTGRAIGDRIEIMVDDEGPGVPEPERSRVWEPFVRLGRDQEAAVAGTGLGLAVVRELMDAQRGGCRIEASGTGGTRAVVWWPKAMA